MASGYTSPMPPTVAVEFHLKMRNRLATYKKLMIVSNKVVTKLDSVSLGVVQPTHGISSGTGDGATVGEPTVGISLVVPFLPTPGISPANAVPERTLASVIANNSRFIDSLL